jgi:hypothetical protein
MPEPALEMLPPYSDGRPRYQFPDVIDEPDFFQIHPTLYLDRDQGGTWSLDTGCTKSFIAPIAMAFNILAAEIVANPDGRCVLVDGAGNVHEYYFHVPVLRILARDGHRRPSLCVYAREVAMLMPPSCSHGPPPARRHHVLFLVCTGFVPAGLHK